MGVVKVGFKLILANVLLMLYIAYGPGLLDFQPLKYFVELPSKFEDALIPNDHLNQAEILFQGKIAGPESLAVYEGDIYTGTNDGSIVKISKDKLTVVTKTGSDCELQTKSSTCGRPLGLRFDKKGNLYVADAYCGILMVNLRSGSVETLLPLSTEVEGKAIMLPNDLDIDEEQGIIYFTDTSTKWPFNRIFYVAFEYSSSGRVLSFNLHTKAIKVVADGLYFPNGVQLSHDKSELLIAEWSNRRILKIALKGSNAGQTTTFADRFPGEPDNIRPSSTGGYWVALTAGRNSSSLALCDYLAEYPLAEHFTLIFQLLPKYGMIMELNSDGEILRSMHSPDGSISYLSEVLEFQDNLYVGSFINSFLVKMAALSS
ncbi:adipocyte plasma membrane-associated protein-like isoform X2 [Limulus polyphemus]|uniref:Adipocyte plasma membrane-associated protein-like isoform X2 n=1 Tax=Limulus polyphemus TaxID=6850 RepID=A0ABM1S582_LIMPO|nr:adipocyte plasma membrane-associated protein-like isoform X2 [Limulus polyphemus]